MKKEKFFKAMFNVITYTMLLWAILCAVWAALPLELKEFLPLDGLSALISGTSTATVGTFALVLENRLKKNTKLNEDKVNQVIEKYGEVVSVIKEFKETVEKNTQKVIGLEQEQKRSNLLLEVDLKAKLDNPLIDAKVKEMIEGVIDVEKVEDTI